MFEFTRLFKKRASTTSGPTIKFGRYSDSYKESEKYQHWDNSIQLFEGGSFLDAFEQFLKYLSDDENQNLSYNKSDDTIEFELFQGSKKMKGFANRKSVVANVKIAKTADYNIGFLRKLIEMNHELKYSRYALDDDGDISMSFHSSILDCSPYKLYYALKELAIGADKQDDILVADFSELTSVNTGHTSDLTSGEKQIRLDLFNREMSDFFDFINNCKLDINTYPGGLSYLILSVVYRLDYLIKPEGKTMLGFEQIHKTFFRQNSQSPLEKNRELLTILKKLNKPETQSFYDELYKVKSTFGLMAPTTHSSLVQFVQTELPNMDWYFRNDYKRFALAVPEYIVGYCLYNYALPAPDRALLELYYRITDKGFFEALGYPEQFVTDGALNKKTIIQAINSIQDKYEEKYHLFKPKVKTLDFASVESFAKSYLKMIAALSLKTRK